MIVTFRIRRDTAANWTTANPVLAVGEPGLETDTRRVKYGDGATAWAGLAYSATGVAWGQITGSLANQTDLMVALGNLAPKAGANLTPATITGGQWVNASRLQTQCRVTFDDGAGNFELMANGIFNGSDLRLGAGFAGRIEFNASVGNWRFQTAATGAANASVSYTERFVIENTGAVRPGIDNTQSIGSASFRFTQMFAASGTINTSDQNAKKFVAPIPDAWLDAWAHVPKRRFKMKGGGKRWHVGYVAQEVHQAFAACGLDAFQLGLCCYDEWVDEQGTHSRWGLRYDECGVFEAAFNERERAALRKDIAELQALLAATTGQELPR